MGILRRIKNRIMPGPIQVKGSIGLSGYEINASIKPPFMKRITIFRRGNR